MPSPQRKLYCYADESGQDTQAQPGRQQVFVVSIAIFDEKRDELEKVCQGYEQASGKRKKWNKTRQRNRLDYIRRIIADPRFQDTLCYSISHPITHPDYDARTILGIAKAVKWKQPVDPYTVEVYVDGISGAKQSEYSLELRGLGIKVRRVHPARDESYPLIRLADAIAGLAREATEGSIEAAALLNQAIRKKVITEV
jgi:hypothetical protein